MATTGIARIAETHAAMGRLPAPQLPERHARLTGRVWCHVCDDFLKISGFIRW